MSYFNIVLSDEQATVVSEFKANIKHNTEYQDEKNLEKNFIDQLTAQGYEELKIKSSQALVDNLRTQLEELNHIKFSNDEWLKFSKENIFITTPNNIQAKTDTIQNNHLKLLKRDDGSEINIMFLDKKHIHNNKLQVMHQYETDKGIHENRYDVTILVNGLPLVHIELKKRGVAIKEAFNQIERYQRDSFWADTGLFEFVQIFVISNGTNTKYYSNTTRWNHTDGKRSDDSKKTSNSFEFTSFWADAKNNHINDLEDFTSNFFAKNRLLSILTKYCVFTADQNLLVMRPYQIVATERILNRIEIAHNQKAYGSIKSGGYIWHTTGSGKTLTSFKTAQLATKLDYIDKILFVVDRKDLDYQTMREYDKFEPGAANSNRSTAILEKQLNDNKAKIIITTIQKLSNFIKKHKKHDVFNKQIIMIFDECHRSQFGQMHKDIINNFKNYYIFGFTGTPITAVNAQKGVKSLDKTTEQTFGDRLHAYTIDNAINDNNVLKFKVSYLSTMKNKEGVIDEEVEGIDTKKAFLSKERIHNNCKYIFDNFDRLTYRKDANYYSFNVITNVLELSTDKNNKKKTKTLPKLIKGFNSILAVSSIDAAKLYYTELQKLNKENPLYKKRVAIIYSYGVNTDEELNGIIDDECSEDTNSLSKPDRDFLESAIKDYNKMYGCSFDTSADKFPNYYKDVSLRMKNMEIDILVVVNMFLTGFDATTLNTLWVDKRLKQHGLIQAFSRTNRILNSVKTFGNIVCFINLKRQVQDAIALFADKNANSIIQLLPYECYYNGYDKNGIHEDGYIDCLTKLRNKFPLNIDIIGESKEKEYISLFGKILRLRNILVAFDEFKDIELPERELQDYQSRYLDLKDKYSKVGNQAQLTDVNEDIVFETELIEQEDYGVDYILQKVAKYHDDHVEDATIAINIQKAIDASPTLRSKKALIEAFIQNINDMDSAISYVKEWNKFATQEFDKELDKLVKEFKLNPQQTRLFIKESFDNGNVKTTGMDINKLLPPMSRFDDKREETKKLVFERIKKIFITYYNAVVISD